MVVGGGGGGGGEGEGGGGLLREQNMHVLKPLWLSSFRVATCPYCVQI